MSNIVLYMVCFNFLLTLWLCVSFLKLVKRFDELVIDKEVKAAMEEFEKNKN